MQFRLQWIGMLLPVAMALSACQATRHQDVQLLDLDDRTVQPLASSTAPARVFIFTRSDCPISNRFAPTVQQLQAEFQPRGVEFSLVYPDPDATASDIRTHLKEYGYTCAALRDPQHQLVALTGATITPEAAVFDRSSHLIYCGRINDLYVDLGKSRAAPSSHDLRNAIEAALDRRPVARKRISAVGCLIADLRPQSAVAH